MTIYEIIRNFIEQEMSDADLYLEIGEVVKERTENCYRDIAEQLVDEAGFDLIAMDVAQGLLEDLK